MRKFIFVLFFVASASLLFAYKSYSPTNTLDTHMTPSDQRKTGVHKLSPEEKKALQQWINKHHIKRPGTRPNEYPVISEVISGGAYLRLSDGSIWEVIPADWAISQSWITPVEIIPEKEPHSEDLYILTNSLTGSTIRAKKISSLPKSAEIKPKKTSPPKRREIEENIPKE